VGDLKLRSRFIELFMESVRMVWREAYLAQQYGSIVVNGR
jgi:hypothetical protein